MSEPQRLSWLQMSDAIAEARENVKFLATLNKSLGPVYSSSPRELRDALPALFSALHMLQAASKYAFGIWIVLEPEVWTDKPCQPSSLPCTGCRPPPSAPWTALETNSYGLSPCLGLCCPA